MTVVGFMLVDANLERTSLLLYFSWAVMFIPSPLLFEPSFLTMCSHRNTVMFNHVSWKPSKENLCQNTVLLSIFYFHIYLLFPFDTFLLILFFFNGKKQLKKIKQKWENVIFKWTIMLRGFFQWLSKL